MPRDGGVLSNCCNPPPRSRYDTEVSVINFHTKEISVKIVYYGPGLCGKTTSLQTIYASLPVERRPQIVSLATEVDRTIFFDFLPVTAYRIRDFKVRLQLYTVPGQVFYNATRKLVLNGVDGIVFVADSQTAMRDSTLESLVNLDENLADLGLEPEHMPIVIQFNKRDLKDIYSVEEMDKLYNPRRVPVFATVAVSGEGLFDALRAISQMVVNNLLRKGLGKQLGPQNPGADAANREASRGGLSDTLGAAAEAASRAIDGAPPAAPPPSPAPLAVPTVPKAASYRAPSIATEEHGLWPDGPTMRLTDKIDAALDEGRSGDAILAIDDLLRFVAAQWATTQGGGSTGDPVPSFLLVRGLSSTRYRSLLEAAVAVRAGRTVDRAQVMNALIIALEAIW